MSVPQLSGVGARQALQSVVATGVEKVVTTARDVVEASRPAIDAPASPEARRPLAEVGAEALLEAQVRERRLGQVLRAAARAAAEHGEATPAVQVLVNDAIRLA